MTMHDESLSSFFIVLIMYSTEPMYPYTTPACIPSIVFVPSTDFGFTISISGSLAVIEVNAFRLIPKPG